MSDSASGDADEKKERAEAAAAHALGQLASKVGNELNNPLAAILSAHQYLRAKLAGSSVASGDPRIAHFFELVERELGTMARVVDDLRVFGAPVRVARSAFLVRDLVDEVLAQVRRPRGITLENRVDESLPPVHLDRDACRRALVQLVRNAVESYDATATGEVTIDGKIEAGHLELTVRDQGAGIPAEVLPRMRDPLYGTKAKGTGLGLTIAEQLIAAQGGVLTCDSEPGRGSVFTVRLAVS
jgi:signal transduction histidine kinase